MNTNFVTRTSTFGRFRDTNFNTVLTPIIGLSYNGNRIPRRQRIKRRIRLLRRRTSAYTGLILINAQINSVNVTRPGLTIVSLFGRISTFRRYKFTQAKEPRRDRRLVLIGIGKGTARRLHISGKFTRIVGARRHLITRKKTAHLNISVNCFTRAIPPLDSHLHEHSICRSFDEVGNALVEVGDELTAACNIGL